MRLPKFQWLIEENTPPCGGCPDVLNLPIDSDKQFQVILSDSDEVILTEDLSTNPFERITGTSLGFTFNGSTSVGQYFTFYSCGKIFIFAIRNTGGTSTSDTVAGNIHFISIYGAGTSADVEDRLANAWIDFVDTTCGTTTLAVGTAPKTFVISNIPTGSYLDNSNGYLGSVGGVTPNDIVANNFIYGSTDCDTLGYYTVNTGNSNYQLEPISLTSGQVYKFDLNYSSDFADFVVTLKIDDGTNVQTGTFTVTNTSNGTASVDFTALLTASTTFTIQIADSAENNEGFCILGYTLSKEAVIDKIESTDCDGNIADVGFTEERINSNTLVTIDSELPTQFKLKITSSDGYIINSIWYKLIASTACQNLQRVTWSSDCTFGEIDYLNLPFTNDVYFKGFNVRLSKDNKERTQVTTSTGTIDTIFNHSVGKRQFQFGLHTEFIFDVLDRVFEHKTFTIDGLRYKLDSDSNLLTTQSNNFQFIGRIDLIKSGTEVVSSTCCCVSSGSGGDGII